MSPGPTFDRVYAALKAQLASARWAPGAHLEPAALGDELSASITPVRDALHRLAGERLVDAPRHDGFWVPVLVESELAALYAWRSELVAWTLRRSHPPLAPASAQEPFMPPELFVAIARRTGIAELAHAVAASTDRLAEYSGAEAAALPDIAGEAAGIAACLAAADRSGLRRAAAAYHQRRQRSAPRILEARRHPGGERDR